MRAGMGRWGAAVVAAVWVLGGLVQPAAATTVEYIHTDALGTPVAVTDANRNVIERSEYEPYGEVINRPLRDGPGYTGHVEDAATGLVHAQQRYYDPGIGRFLSVDPVTANSGTGTNFNRYWYAAGNPYKFVDPDGRIIRPPGMPPWSGCGVWDKGKCGPDPYGRDRVQLGEASVPEVIRVEGGGFATAGAAAKDAAATHAETGIRNRQELQVGLIQIGRGNWGWLTPGWGAVGDRNVKVGDLFDAYTAAGLKPHSWLHGHWDSQLNFSAQDFQLVWGKPHQTFIVKEGLINAL